VKAPIYCIFQTNERGVRYRNQGALAKFDDEAKVLDYLNHNLRADWHYRITVPHRMSMTPQQFAAWMRKRLASANP